MQCHAMSKQRRARCRQPVVPGKDVCYYHGGKTPQGPALPQFKTGRYSKCLPARLLAGYRAAERDPELTQLRSDIALVDARMMDLLSRVDTGEAGAVWRQAKAALRRFHLAQARQDPDKMHEHLYTLQGLTERGAGDYAAWQEIGAQMELRRRLCESEHKRMVLLQQYISTERAMVLLELVVDIVKRHIPDRQTLSAIAFELQQLCHVEPRPTLRVLPPLAQEEP
jgi:hypothetical protein